jgi:hypothetical protein
LAGARAWGCVLALCHRKWQVTLSQLALQSAANVRNVLFQADTAGVVMLLVGLCERRIDLCPVDTPNLTVWPLP